MQKLTRTQAEAYSVQLNEILNNASASWVLIEIAGLLKRKLDSLTPKTPEWFELVNPTNMIRSLGFILRDFEKLKGSEVVTDADNQA